MFFAGTQPQNLENNFIVETAQKGFHVHPHIRRAAILLFKKDGLTYRSPFSLFLGLIFLELSDIILLGGLGAGDL